MWSIDKLRAWVRSVVSFRIKRWHTAMRGWDEKDVRVLISLEDNPWYWVLLEWLFWDNGTWICHWAHSVPLPKFIRNIEGHWDDDDPEYYVKFEQWFGDDFGCLYHLYICDPLLQWVWKHKSKHEPQFELTLDEARQKFAHDPEVYRWIEKSVEQHKQWDAEKAAEEAAENDLKATE